MEWRYFLSMTILVYYLIQCFNMAILVYHFVEVVDSYFSVEEEEGFLGGKANY
jgi:hypothetical protein